MWSRTKGSSVLGNAILFLATARPYFYWSGLRSFVVSAETILTNTQPSFRTVQVQVVHRHGDRSPITPMKDEAFWASQLVDDYTKSKIAQDTEILREMAFSHAAGARGPFGKLSQLGLLQMVQVGTTLAEELMHTTTSSAADGDNISKEPLFFTPLFSSERPIHPSHMQVFSTDFERTVQSVQGLLVGLFPEGNPAPVTIDVRHTILMIPDPQPRRFAEQYALETHLTQRPYVLQREHEMLPLAVSATKALHDMLGPGAHEVSFGVVQEASTSIEVEPLQWNQLAEITACLDSRGLLPNGVTKLDKKEIAKHTAWRWFQTLSHPRLIYLAMHDFVMKQINIFTGSDDPSSKSLPLTIWSAHDSTLIGLLCAYRLQRPATWPEYASYLVMELVENVDTLERFVRFSLNGERLQSQWEGTPAYDMIPLDLLRHKLETVGSQPSEFAAATE